MQKVTGNSGVQHIECINPKKDKWRIRWAIVENEDGTAEYMEEDFNHKPSVDEVRKVILDWYNAEIDAEIISGFKWQGKSVWLSTENQFNYKAAYDLAVQTNGASLPVKFKFGTDDDPYYYEFAELEELGQFYTQSMAYVQSVLEKGWETKDKLNFKHYEA